MGQARQKWLYSWFGWGLALSGCVLDSSGLLSQAEEVRADPGEAQVGGDGGPSNHRGVVYLPEDKDAQVFGADAQWQTWDEHDPAPEGCANGVHDGLETDVDCGGAQCDRCGSGQRCDHDIDCRDLPCLEGRCRPESCADGRLGAGETDIDCGGGRCPPCAVDRTCRDHDDCDRGVCGHRLRCVRVESCFQAKEATGGTPSGLYYIVPDGASPVRVYCDMTTDGGGWTLVGRSALGAWNSFGWGDAQGKLTDHGRPYSLDAVGRKIRFRQILVGSYRKGFDWGDRVFRIVLPNTCLSTSVSRSCPVGAAATVKGRCHPKGGPKGLRSLGFLDRNDGFYFGEADRPSGKARGTGLTPRGWRFDASNCNSAGDLDGMPGMIMVR